MSQTDLIALLVYASAMSFTPGPNTALAASLAATHGLRATMPFVCAVPVGWAALVALSTAAVNVVSVSPLVREALVYLAIVYMVVLAWMIARRRHLAKAPAGVAPVRFGHGIALQFANGKAWLNALTVSASWVAMEGQTTSRLAVVLPLMAAFGFSSNFVYAVLGSRLRSWLATGSRLTWFNRMLALMLLVTAGWLFTTVAAGEA